MHTTLDAGIGYTSIDITVNYLRPVTVDSGTRWPWAGYERRRVALVAAEIRDGAGRLVPRPAVTAGVSALEYGPL